MSTEASTPDYGTPGGASATPSASRRSAEPPSLPKPAKPQRVLACVLCQQRKVKCDRRFPCVNCTRAKVTCVPATLGTRKRRPRFPERHLLDRIRHYEDLLRQHDVDFEPLHKDPKADRYHLPALGAAGPDDDSDGDVPPGGGPPAADKPSPSSAAARPLWPYKDFWHAMRRGYCGEDSDDSDEAELGVHEGAIKSAWDRMATQMGEANDHLFFGMRTTSVDLSTLHPGPVQIFKLWQVYLDHVNPLLKATHTPSLQARIVTAVSELGRVDPNLEALMFGIYCVAITSMVDSSCLDTFGESKNDLLTRYQFGCQQALLNASFLRTNDTDCLAALVFYLITVRSKTDPASLSSLLSVALRIAQRIGIAFETGKEESPVLDVEMHRRLWWALVLFDARVGELTRDSKTSPLALSWNAHIPLNVSESDLQPGSKELPMATSACSDALFVVVRAELANFMRHVDFYRMVINPSVELSAVDMRPSTESCLGRPKTVAALEQAIEDKYLRFCDPQIPLHYMTMWTTRSSLAKYRIMEMYSGAAGQVTTDTFTFWAIRWLECDTRLLTSPLTSGFGWMVNMYFPFPAYIQVLHDLRRRPVSKQAARGWEAVSANFAAHITSGDDYPSMFVAVGGRDNPFFEVLLNMVVLSWEPREAALAQDGADVEIPWVVGHLRRLAAEARQDKNKAAAAAGGPPPPSLNENLMSAMDLGGAASGVGSGGFPMAPAPTDGFGGMGGAPMMPSGPYPAAAPDMVGYQPFGRDVDMSAMNSMLDVDDTSWMKYFMN